MARYLEGIKANWVGKSKKREGAYALSRSKYLPAILEHSAAVRPPPRRAATAFQGIPAAKRYARMS